MVQMDEKQVILTNKTVSSMALEASYPQWSPIMVVMMESFRPPKIVPKPPRPYSKLFHSLKYIVFHPFEPFGGHPGPFRPKY